MRYLLLLTAALVLLTSCGDATPTTTTYPTATTVQGCDNVAHIVTSSSDAVLEMSRVYTFIQKEKPEIVGTEFEGRLVQISRQGGYDLITVSFSNDLGTMLFIQEPVKVLHIAWEGAANSESQVRDWVEQKFPGFPTDVVDCHDMSVFVSNA